MAKTDNARIVEHHPPVVVLESVKPPSDTVKFVDQVVRYAPDTVLYKFFSWRLALLTSFDVFHVHFPDGLLRASTRPRTVLKHILFGLLLLRLRFARISVVRTVHNVRPHDSVSSAGAVLLNLMDKRTDVFVTLNPCTEVPGWGRVVEIPHGDFKEQFASRVRYTSTLGRVLVFGRIRPYKGVLELLRAVDDDAAEGVELRVVGEPTVALRAEIESELRRSNRRGARVTTDLRTVSDQEMVDEISQAEMVLVLNEDLGQSNSGVALVALSLGRPIATRRNCVTESLAHEAGPGWVVFLEDGPPSAAALKAKLDEVRVGRRGDAPDLRGRDWRTVGAQYASVFESCRREGGRRLGSRNATAFAPHRHA